MTSGIGAGSVFLSVPAEAARRLDDSASSAAAGAGDSVTHAVHAYSASRISAWAEATSALSGVAITGVAEGASCSKPLLTEADYETLKPLFEAYHDSFARVLKKMTSNAGCYTFLFDRVFNAGNSVLSLFNRVNSKEKPDYQQLTKCLDQIRLRLEDSEIAGYVLGPRLADARIQDALIAIKKRG